MMNEMQPRPAAGNMESERFRTWISVNSEGNSGIRLGTA